MIRVLYKLLKCYAIISVRYIKIWSKLIFIFVLGAIAGIAYYIVYHEYQELGTVKYSVVHESISGISSEAYASENIHLNNVGNGAVQTVDEGDESQELGQSSPYSSIDDIVNKVYILESSGGKNDSCRNKGLWNGYGYAQSTFTWNCYESHEEVRSLVVKWFEKHLQDKTVAESLCYYNLGIVQSDCKYYQNYLSL